MLTTTLEFSRQAWSIKLRWPAWSAPMVGTRPIESRSPRHFRDAASIDRGSSNTAKGLSGAVLDLLTFFRAHRRGTVRRIRVLGPRKLAARHLSGETLGGVRDVLGQVGIPLDELRRLSGRQAQHVVVDEHLAVGAGSRADSDRRDAEALSHPACELTRNAFEDQGARPGLLQLLRVGHDPGRLGLALALDLEATHLVHELRRQP